jgi:AbrB family looped-hinge helix DNA binding protein
MTYLTTITQKGQITIPKKIRDTLHLKTTDNLAINLSKKNKIIQIKPVKDFLTVIKDIKISKKINPLKARKLMEKTYERN